MTQTNDDQARVKDVELIEEPDAAGERPPAKVEPENGNGNRAPVRFGERGVQLRSYEDAYRFADSVRISGLSPKGFETTPKILIAMQLGAELGMPPMQSLQNIAVINGKPSIYGDAGLAIVRSHPEFESMKEGFIGKGDEFAAVCTIKRRGQDEHVTTFSIADAKRAKLWGNQGTWSQYPNRMLMWRARSFNCRDVFPDALCGLAFAEELKDIPASAPRSEQELNLAAEMERATASTSED